MGLIPDSLKGVLNAVWSDDVANLLSEPLAIAPHGQCVGKLVFRWPGVDTVTRDELVGYERAFLHVTDNVSGQMVIFKVPGQYPPVLMPSLTVDGPRDKKPVVVNPFL